MPKGVLFDLDGTLLDSAPDFVVSLDNLREKHNQPKLDPEIIRSHVSDGSWKLVSLGFNIDVSDKNNQLSLGLLEFICPIVKAIQELSAKIDIINSTYKSIN